MFTVVSASNTRPRRKEGTATRTPRQGSEELYCVGGRVSSAGHGSRKLKDDGGQKQYLF